MVAYVLTHFHIPDGESLYMVVAIDGFSELIVYINAATVLDYYLETGKHL